MLFPVDDYATADTGYHYLYYRNQLDVRIIWWHCPNIRQRFTPTGVVMTQNIYDNQAFFDGCYESVRMIKRNKGIGGNFREHAGLKNQ
ncbi:hypothetical protein BSQ97_19795 [Serratia proteamaculans]|nr:hypothetical protein BSQ97_19795 [Serratia proteamaculans]